MLLLFICFENFDCDIYNVLYCLYIECKINLSIYMCIYLFIRLGNYTNDYTIRLT